MRDFDLPGVLRRIRRRVDLSQRELAASCGVSQSSIAQAESGRRGLPVDLLSRLAGLAGLRLALVDEAGVEVAPMAPGAVRDRANRRFPAHLDTRYGDDDWWHGRHRYAREQPWYTFDRDRGVRDRFTRRDEIPDDHQLPRPGDSPEQRRQAVRVRAEAERRRRFAERLPPAGPDPLTCTCPPGCDELDDWNGRPVHADECPCRCDVG